MQEDEKRSAKEIYRKDKIDWNNMRKFHTITEIPVENRKCMQIQIIGLNITIKQQNFKTDVTFVYLG